MTAALTGAATGEPSGAGSTKVSSPSRRRLTLAVGYAAGAVVAAGLAWWLAVHGVATDSWPAFAPGSDSTAITRYSGAWLTAAAGAALVAALLLVAAVRQWVRARRGPTAVAPRTVEVQR